MAHIFFDLCSLSLRFAAMAAATENVDNGLDNQPKSDSEPAPVDLSPPAEEKPLSKNAQKKQLKQQRYEAKKAEKKAQEKEQKRKEGERKHKEWEETLAKATEEERLKLIESRKNLRKERMEKRSEEKEKKMERLTRAKEIGQNVVVDVDFAHLMSESEISSLVQQVNLLSFNQIILCKASKFPKNPLLSG